jgi:hypothetical protein
MTKLAEVNARIKVNDDALATAVEDYTSGKTTDSVYNDSRKKYRSERRKINTYIKNNRHLLN